MERLRGQLVATAAVANAALVGVIGVAANWEPLWPPVVFAGALGLVFATLNTRDIR